MELNKIFNGKYKILRLIGKGGMGEVYLAENINLKNLWVIKRIDKKKNEDIDFLAEPNMLKKLKHSALPVIVDIVEDDKYLYIITDYIDGISLDKKLEELNTINEATVVQWAKDICDALRYLHNLKPNPVIYRDMKPSNIMLDSDGKIKIIDFGIAREYKKNSNKDTTCIGTAGFAAPEQYGDGQSDARTDIYALGVTMYNLLTGKTLNEPPYKVIPVRKLDKNLSVGIEYIINKCTELDPNKRYQDVDALLKDLNNIHKFGKAYKKKQAISILKNLVFVVSIISFSYLIFKGVVQLDIEKQEDYKEKISSGVELVAKNKYDDAINTFKEASSDIPEKIDAYREIANLELKQNNYEKCIEYINSEVFGKVPNSEVDLDIIYILATSYFEMKDYDNAIRWFEKADDFHGSNVNYKRDLAVSYARKGNLNRAKSVLNDINSKGLAEEVSYYVQGEILIASKDFEKGLESFRKCIEITKDESLKIKAYVSSAQALEENLDNINDGYKRLVKILEQARNSLNDKNNIMIIEMLGKAYYINAGVYSNEKYEYLSKSVTSFENLITLGYNRPYIYKNISGIYKQLNRYDKAEEYLLKMQELYPEDYSCYEALAFLYAELENKKPNDKRDYSKTLQYYNSAIKNNPKGENAVELQPLVKLLRDLKAGNWIK